VVSKYHVYVDYIVRSADRDRSPLINYVLAEMKASVRVETAFRAVSAVSVCSSFLVAITCLGFPSLRRSFFTRIILMIAICDILVGMVGTFGFAYGYLCVIQAVVQILFLRANWIWTTMLVLQMYRFIAHNKVFFSEKLMHVIVWTISALLAFMPLVMATYGREGSFRNAELCFLLSDNTKWEFAWIQIEWIISCFGCIAVMMFYITKIYLKYVSSKNSTQVACILHLIKSLYLYPAVMFLTWGVATLFNEFYETTSPTYSESMVLDIVLTVALSNGFFISLVFFWKSPEARRRWRNILCRKEINGAIGTLDFNETNSELTETIIFSSEEIWRSSSFVPSEL
jgi:hypothetical protein